MKQRINLYAAGCALLILLCFFLIPFHGIGVGEMPTDFYGKLELARNLGVKNTGWMDERELEEAIQERISPDPMSTAEMIEQIGNRKNQIKWLWLIPIMAGLLLLSGLFLDGRTSRGMGVMACVTVVWLIISSLSACAQSGYEYGSTLSIGAGSIICFVLFVLFCFMEGFRKYLPGYRPAKANRMPANGYAPAMAYQQPYYPAAPVQPMQPIQPVQPQQPAAPVQQNSVQQPVAEKKEEAEQ